ncbi:hypothetical protein GGR58DRAFT_525363 [Xylaria digitata]|nr:hypothetical protein GGR58DRAFT_525363 [Xylaria digitata]
MKTNPSFEPDTASPRCKLVTTRQSLVEQFDILGNLIEESNDNNPNYDTGGPVATIRYSFGILGTLINEFDNSSELRTHLHPKPNPQQERGGSREDTERRTKEESKTTQKESSGSTTRLHREREREQEGVAERAVGRAQNQDTLEQISTNSSHRVPTLRLADVRTIFAFCALVFVTQHGVTLCVMGHVVIFTKIVLLIINYLGHLAVLRRWFFGAPLLCRRKDV